MGIISQEEGIIQINSMQFTSLIIYRTADISFDTETIQKTQPTQIEHDKL